MTFITSIPLPRRGKAYYEWGEFQKAIHDFDKALEINEKFFKPIYNYQARD